MTYKPFKKQFRIKVCNLIALQSKLSSIFDFNNFLKRRGRKVAMEKVPFRCGLIYTPKMASFDGDHRKRLGLVFAWGYTKKKN